MKELLSPLPPFAAAPELSNTRRPPVANEEIVARLSELMEVEQAIIDVSAVLQQVEPKGLTDAEIKKFAENATVACLALQRAILRYGGQISDQTGNSGQEVCTRRTEEDRLKLMAQWIGWVVRKLDRLLRMPLDPETQACLIEIREAHRENFDACGRRAEELSWPSDSPYRELPFVELREVHDRLYYGPWRRPGATDRDIRRGYAQIGRFLFALAAEVHRTRSLPARSYLATARAAYMKADVRSFGMAALGSLDIALSYAHSALNALLDHYRAPVHNPREFAFLYDVVCREVM